MALDAPVSGPVGERTPPITSDDLAAYIKVAEPDAAMQGVVDAAIELVEVRCGPITDTAWTYLVELDSSGALILPCGPIGSVDALVDADGTDRVDQLTAVDVSWKHGIIWPPTRRRGTWAVTVTTHRAAGVAELIEASLVIARHLWTTRRGGDVRPNVGMTNDATNPIVIPSGYALPSRAAELISDYLRPMAG